MSCQRIRSLKIILTTDHRIRRNSVTDMIKFLSFSSTYFYEKVFIALTITVTTIIVKWE